MASLNKVILIGHLGGDPETRYLPSGDPVTNFSIATTEKWKDKDGDQQERTEWHRINVFGKLADIAGEYLKKGDPCYIEGRIRTNKYEKDGQDHYSTNIICDKLLFLKARDRQGSDNGEPRRSYREEKGRGQQRPSGGGDGKGRTKGGSGGPGGFNQMDDDIPFLFNTSSVLMAILTARSTGIERARYGKEKVREVRASKADF